MIAGVAVNADRAIVDWVGERLGRLGPNWLWERKTRAWDFGYLEVMSKDRKLTHAVRLLVSIEFLLLRFKV